MSKNQTFTIKTAAAELGLSPQYVRRSISKGNLKSTQVATNDKGGFRHEITKADLMEWNESRGAHSSRSDGRNKYTVYATPEEHEKLTALITKAELSTPISRANPPKVTANKPEPEAAS